MPVFGSTDSTRLLEDLQKRADTQSDAVHWEGTGDAEQSSPAGESQAASAANSPGRTTPTAQLTNPFSHLAPRYVADSTGRPWYLGTSSNWAFNRRVLEIVHERLTGVAAPTDTLSFDGTLYDLGWDGDRDVAADQHLIPSADYAMFLVNAVKFHCGQMFHLFDETTFMQGFRDYYDSSKVTTNTHGLWYVHFLFILAFGKAFVARRKSPRKAPGSELYVQAIKLLPDIMFLIEQPVQAVEILCCKALYLQCLDFRCAAYNVVSRSTRRTDCTERFRLAKLYESHSSKACKPICVIKAWTMHTSSVV